MTYIESNARPVNTTTYANADAAIAAFTAPAWAGAPETEITMLSETSFKSRGIIYYIVDGENPTEARRAAKAQAVAAPKLSKRDVEARRGGHWLSREMDREDSKY